MNVKNLPYNAGHVWKCGSKSDRESIPGASCPVQQNERPCIWQSPPVHRKLQRHLMSTICENAVIEPSARGREFGCHESPVIDRIRVRNGNSGQKKLKTTCSANDCAETHVWMIKLHLECARKVFLRKWMVRYWLREEEIEHRWCGPEAHEFWKDKPIKSYRWYPDSQAQSVSSHANIADGIGAAGPLDAVYREKNCDKVYL